MKKLITTLLLILCSVTMAMGEETIPPTTMVSATLSDGTLTITADNGSTTDLLGAVKEEVSDDKKASVKKVVITSDIVAGESLSELFYGYIALQTIEGLDKLNTYSVTDMDYMFYDCRSLSSLDLSNFNTKKVTDMSRMFLGCRSLSSLDLSNFNTDSVTDMSSMFRVCSSLSSLDLSNFNTKYVTSMSYMFSDCSSLSSLDLSNFNTEKVTDMSYMFSDCSSLSSLDLSNFNTDSVTTMRKMFGGCSSLSSLDLSNFNTDSVTSMSNMFYGCSSLSSLDLSDFNTDSVTTMSSMFRGCSSLSSLDLSNFNTENVTSMYGMFSGCSSLSSLDLSDFNTEKVTDMFGMFGDCSSLSSLDLSDFNTDSVTDMSGMFRVCTSLSSLDLSNFNTENVTSMYSMFSGCSSLSSLDLLNFNTEKVTDMGYMFLGCSSLSSLDLSNFNTEKVTTMFGMFYDCSSLSSLDLSNFNTEKVTDMDIMFYDVKLQSITLSDSIRAGIASQILLKDGYYWAKDDATYDAIPTTGDYATTGTYIAVPPTTMVSATLLDGTLTITADKTSKTDLLEAVSDEVNDYKKSSVKKVIIKDYIVAGESLRRLFDDYTALQTIEGLDKLNTEKVTDMSYMFVDCSSLSSLDLSDFNTKKVTDMSGMFYYCISLSSLDLSDINTEKVTDMSYMFSDCSSLSSLDLSDFNTEKVTDMIYMFGGCSSLSSLDLSNFNTDSVTTMYGMFFDCSSLSSLDLSDFNTDSVTNMSQMFGGCSSLSSLDLSDFNTKNVTDMSYMFSGCSSLSSLDLSSFNTEKVMSMYGMFYCCSSLSSLDLSGFNTKNVAEMSSMFSDVKLQSITLSDNIQAGIASQILLKDGYEWAKDDTTYDAIPTLNDLIVKGTYTAKYIDYIITYNLYDGTNASTNPATYTIETETIALSDASKTNYDFKGWYSEDTYTTQVTAIAKGTTGDKNLYAKWEMTLAYTKEIKKADIDALNTYSIDDYRTAEWTALQTIFTDAKADVDSLTTKEDVEAYDITGLMALADAIKTDAQLTAEELALATAKATAKDTLANYANKDDYRTAEQEDLATAITNGNTAIDKSTDIAGVTKAIADAQAVIDAIKTDAQFTADELALATAKTTAKASLSSYADKTDYRTAEQEDLATAIENGNTAIDKSTDIAGVTKSLADAKAVIDAIKTDAELTAEEDTTTVKPPVEPEDTTTVIPPVEPEDTTTVTPPVEPEDTTTVDPTPEPEDTTTVTPPVEPEDTTTVDQTPEVYTITADLKGGKLPADVVIPTTYTIATEDIVLPTTLTMAPDTMMSTELITSVMVYKFAGWVDANKKAITTIAKGTTGNITLTATWTAETIVGLIDQVKEESYNSDVLVVGPMPINNKSKVFYTVEEAGVYTLELYNLAEKLMSTTKVEAQDGRNITNWTALQMLPKGVYYIAVKKDREFISLRRIVK